MFVAYLRGIETVLDLSAVTGLSTFVAYLRGIETRGEWKAVQRHNPRPQFVAYLRGIETLIAAL